VLIFERLAGDKSFLYFS